MREILFRAKAINRDPNREYRTNYKNGDWIYGLIERIYDERCPNIPSTMIDQYGVSNIDVDYKTISEYTGLTDKNGKKIFEWDIVKCYDKNVDESFFAIIMFGNPNGFYNYGWQLKPIGKTDFNVDILCWVDMEDTGAYIEIIGNIFENPELFGGKINGRT